MDPVSMVVTALALGAAAGVKGTAEQVIKDAYTGLKALIQGRYKEVQLTALEQQPGSKAKRDSVAEELIKAGAAGDHELLAKAKALIDGVEKHDRAAVETVGIDLEKVKAAYLKVKTVTSQGTGVRVKNSDFSRGIDIDGVQSGEVNGPSDPQER